MRLFIVFICFYSCLGLYAQKADSLHMDSVVHTLPDVMIKGERPLAKVQGSAIIYDLPRLIAKKGALNIYEALKELPGIMEQDGKLSLAGFGTTFIIDGKVSTLSADEITALLKAMPPSKIDKVEVYYNAPAKLQVRGAVVNIRLKHGGDSETPLQGELGGVWAQKHEPTFDEHGTLLLNSKKFAMDLFYQHVNRKTYRTIEFNSRHTLNDGTTHHIESFAPNRYKGYGHRVRLGMDYNFSKDHSLTLVYQMTNTSGSSQQTTTGNITSLSDINTHTWLHNLRLDYTAPFGLKAGGELTYYHDPSHENLQSTIPTGMMRLAVDNEQRINRWRFYLAKEHQLKGGWGLNYGATYTTSINHGSQNYVQVHSTTGYSPQSSYTRLREESVNFYVGSNKEFGKKLSAEASLAAEYYHTLLWHEWHFYPTLNLTYRPKEGHLLQLGLSNKREYPAYWTMTPFTTYYDGGYSEITGNPYLKPSSEYQLQLLYLLKNKYQLVTWFTHIDNYFIQTVYQRPDRLSLSYKNLNFNFSEQAGVQMVIPQQFGKVLSSRLTLLGIWRHEKAEDFYDIPFNRHRIWGAVTLNNTLTVSTKPDINLSVNARIRSKSIQATYDLPSSGSVNLSAQWAFMKKKALLRLFCNDLFQTETIDPYVRFKGQDLSVDYSCYRTFGLSFTYKFGGYKEKKRKEADTSRF